MGGSGRVGLVLSEYGRGEESMRRPLYLEQGWPTETQQNERGGQEHTLQEY